MGTVNNKNKTLTALKQRNLNTNMQTDKHINMSRFERNNCGMGGLTNNRITFEQ